MGTRSRVYIEENKISCSPPVQCFFLSEYGLTMQTKQVTDKYVADISSCCYPWGWWSDVHCFSVSTVRNYAFLLAGNRFWDSLLPDFTSDPTFTRCPPQRQRIWMTWSIQLFQFVLFGHPTPRCWTSQEHELSSCVGLFRWWLCTLGTHYHPTLDPAVLWTPSNDTSRPICSES